MVVAPGGPPPPAPPQRPSNALNFRPIKVDNWGIFLLTRLQNYFQKKELCDLTIRFPQRNAQIKVHKLVVNACTEYFSGAEKEGRLLGRSDVLLSSVAEAVSSGAKDDRLRFRLPFSGKLN